MEDRFAINLMYLSLTKKTNNALYFSFPFFFFKFQITLQSTAPKVTSQTPIDLSKIHLSQEVWEMTHAFSRSEPNAQTSYTRHFLLVHKSIFLSGLKSTLPFGGNACK